MVKPEPWENPMLDTMWIFMQMGGPKDLSWENLERVNVTIICEAMALVFSGEYEEKDSGQ